MYCLSVTVIGRNQHFFLLLCFDWLRKSFLSFSCTHFTSKDYYCSTYNNMYINPHLIFFCDISQVLFRLEAKKNSCFPLAGRIKFCRGPFNCLSRYPPLPFNDPNQPPPLPESAPPSPTLFFKNFASKEKIITKQRAPQQDQKIEKNKRTNIEEPKEQQLQYVDSKRDIRTVLHICY